MLLPGVSRIDERRNKRLKIQQVWKRAVAIDTKLNLKADLSHERVRILEMHVKLV